jgi:DNA-binding response OmpR family regulator
MRILVVEDQKKVAGALKRGLEGEGFAVDLASTGEDGYFLLDSKGFDLLILDLGLPGRDGLEILESLRSKNRALPVLILTARDSLQDRVKGLETGADDYLVKPFAFAELVARIRALMRRGRPEFLARLGAADLEIDLATRTVHRGGRKIDLTAREFELLHYLLRHKNQVVTRKMIEKEIWGAPDRVTPMDNIIDVHIAHLRKKIDEGQPKKLIATVRGVGFKVQE